MTSPPGSPRELEPGPERAVVRLLIVLSVSLQGLATSRLLCPPVALESFAPIRIACPPALWPFTDYPMFSEPHRRGESLAWLEAKLETPGRARRSLGLYEVRMGSAGEDWGEAFEREERRLIAALQSVISSSPRSSGLVFERHRLVLTERGLASPDEGERRSTQ